MPKNPVCQYCTLKLEFMELRTKEPFSHILKSMSEDGFPIHVLK